ncbi:hypothetical protein G6F50_018204 [Rhizopus delemar]|uniref:Uncharacterized protein n=1 Tax=Rhizopus delemar TaxID=936053 RepID=A0A9P7BYP6_9FUNG|nr:hypothetical protein G6F50_018204 [Rhizopus delemar]
MPRYPGFGRAVHVDADRFGVGLGQGLRQRLAQHVGQVHGGGRRGLGGAFVAGHGQQLLDQAGGAVNARCQALFGQLAAFWGAGALQGR